MFCITDFIILVTSLNTKRFCFVRGGSGSMSAAEKLKLTSPKNRNSTDENTLGASDQGELIFRLKKILLITVCFQVLL